VRGDETAAGSAAEREAVAGADQRFGLVGVAAGIEAKPPVPCSVGELIVEGGVAAELDPPDQPAEAVGVAVRQVDGGDDVPGGGDQFEVSGRNRGPESREVGGGPAAGASEPDRRRPPAPRRQGWRASA